MEVVSSTLAAPPRTPGKSVHFGGGGSGGGGPSDEGFTTPSRTPSGKTQPRTPHSGKKWVPQEPIRVFLRVRPVVGEENEQHKCIHVTGNDSIVAVAPEGSISHKNLGGGEHTYTFHRVFSGGASQEQVYEEAAKPLVDSVFEGQNSLIFAYGVTNAGKTHTIMGTSQQEGLLPRALSRIITIVSQHNERVQLGADASELLVDPIFEHLDPSYQYGVVGSHLEIYNEKIFDLLSGPDVSRIKTRPDLRINEDENGRVNIMGLSMVQMKTLKDAATVISTGESNRHTAATALNVSSSRSHSVFMIKLIRYQEDICEDFEDIGTISLVDLAGSERIAKSGAQGIRLKEATSINNSLVVLGRCLETLRHNQSKGYSARPVPFRESKLTRIFQDSLLGGGRVIMIANVNPVVADFDETWNTLRYSAVAKEIYTMSKVDTWRHGSRGAMNRDHQGGVGINAQALNDVHEYIEQLLSEIHQLRKNLLDVETSKSEMECQIRQEMAEAMEDRLHHVETFYRQLMDQQMMAAEEKLEKKVELFEREAQRQVECAASDGVRFSSKDWENFKNTVVEMKKTFQKQMLAAQEEKKQLQEKLKEESTRLLSLLKEKEEKEQEILELQNTLATAQISGEITKQELDAALDRINSLVEERDELCLKVEETQDAAAESKSLCEQEESQCQELSQQIQEFQEKQTLLEQQIAEMQGVADQFHDVESALNDAKEEIQQIKDAFAEEKKELLQRALGFKEKVAFLEEKLGQEEAGLGQQIVQLQEEMTHQTEKFEAVQEELQHAKGDIKDFKKNETAFKRNEKKLQKQVDQLSQQVERMQEERAMLLHQMEEERDSRQLVESQLQMVREELGRAQEDKESVASEEDVEGQQEEMCVDAMDSSVIEEEEEEEEEEEIIQRGALRGRKRASETSTEELEAEEMGSEAGISVQEDVEEEEEDNEVEEVEEGQEEDVQLENTPSVSAIPAKETRGAAAPARRSSLKDQQSDSRAPKTGSSRVRPTQRKRSKLSDQSQGLEPTATVTSTAAHSRVEKAGTTVLSNGATLTRRTYGRERTFGKRFKNVARSQLNQKSKATGLDAFEFEGSPVEDKRSKKPQSKGKPKQALENQDVQEEDKENSPAAIKTQAKTGRRKLLNVKDPEQKPLPAGMPKTPITKRLRSRR